MCEEAERIIRETGNVAVVIDIVDDDNLFDRYGMRIPVLKRMDNDTELDWPFDTTSVSSFLK